MSPEEKLQKIRARLDLLEDENADKWGSSRGYAIEDIERILDGHKPLSTKENQQPN